MALWQEGVTQVIMAQSHGTHLFDSDAQKRFNTFVEMSGIKISYIEPNVSWLKELSGVL
jgi:hypothetical protein